MKPREEKVAGYYEDMVFVSYAWGSEDERIVDELEQAFAGHGISIVRDKKSPGYEGPIELFAERIGQGQRVILIISDRFLRSEHCMSELVEIAEHQEFHKRVFPVVLADARIDTPLGRLEYILYWDKKLRQLSEAIRNIETMANLDGIASHVDTYTRIRSSFEDLTGFLSAMNALTPEGYAAHGFSTLIHAVENQKTGRSFSIQPGGNENDRTTKGLPPEGNEEENVHADEVSFTAYHPKEGKVESWHTLLVYTHLLSVLAEVQADVKRFRDQIASPKEITSKSTAAIVRGTEITIVPACEGVTFNPPRISFRWMESFHRSEFRFLVDKSLAGDAAKGQIEIWAGPLLIGSLKFAMLFNDQETSQATTCEEHANMYSKDDVFISYSRKDTEVARAFKNILEATGLDVFLDVDDIRSGQYWQDELRRRIERAKIFQIFWSPNYSESENCRLEWQYALKQNKEEGYIRPVFWKNPLTPKPPEELNKFNFRYVELNLPTT